jgi:hypothetical protein
MSDSSSKSVTHPNDWYADHHDSGDEYRARMLQIGESVLYRIAGAVASYSRIGLIVTLSATALLNAGLA